MKLLLRNFFGREGLVSLLLLSFLLLSAIRPSMTVTPGLTTPEVMGKFLNGNLPVSTPANGNNLSWSVVPAFPNLTFDDPLVLTMHPDVAIDTMFVASRSGVIEQFSVDPDVSEKSLVADFSNEVAVVHDGGFLGMAFHPQMGQNANKDYAYLYYCAKGDDGDSGPFNCDDFCFSCDNDGRWYGSYLRLARYKVVASNGHYTIDKDSELRMINIPLWNATHRGGGLTFGDDGFLYLTIGDQARRLTAQNVSDYFEGGVIRIDVDMQGGTISHAPTHRINTTDPLPKYDFFSQNNAPVNTATSQVTGVGYYIPSDNPHWLTNGDPYFEEFFTVGHRAPHRLTKDKTTGDLWIGEVGADTHEEINVIQPGLVLQNWQNLNGGSNYGWPLFEGFLQGDFTECGSDNLTLTLGVNAQIGPCDPVVHFERGGNKAANAIIGGYVYRGSKLASEIGGRYICGGYSQNRIFAVSFKTDVNGKIIADALPGYPEDAIEVLTSFTPGQLVTFGEDHDGELYMGKLGNAVNLYTLQVSGIGSTPPAQLSQTGAFEDLTDLTPSEGVIPYDLIEPFWSDGAIKSRWLAVPSDNAGMHSTSEEKVVFSANGEWEFPNGTVLIKHFEIETAPGVIRRLETRFEVLGDDDIWYYLTYKWNSAGTDADLLTSGQTETINVFGQNQEWLFPSESECKVCHQGSVGSVLGPKTRNLNRHFTYPKTGISANQLVTLSHLGIIDQAITDENVGDFSALSAKDDLTASLEDRARSYLDVNCSYCHRPETGNQAAFDARFTTDLEQQNLIAGAVKKSLNINGARVIVPQSTAQSILHVRAYSTDPAVRMPPLAKEVADAVGVQVISDWINNLSPAASNDVLVVNGSASLLDGGCYELTAAANFEAGSAWFPERVDLTKRLKINFFLELGDYTEGGEGVVLVLQTAGTSSVGDYGRTMGAPEIIPMLGIEFDSRQDGGAHDIANDHVAIYKNGDFSDQLAVPVCMDALCANMKDGVNHAIQVTWDPASHLLEVFVDGNSRIQYQGDIRQQVFGGTDLVYIGFTGGTNNEPNHHLVCNPQVLENEEPTADLMVTPLSGQAPLLVSFDGSCSYDPDGDDLSYNWDFGDGTVLSDGPPLMVHTYTASGNYTATLTVSDGNLTDLEQKNIMVSVPPSCGLVAAYSENLVSGPASLTVKFDASASNDPEEAPLTHSWDLGDGTTKTGVVITHTYHFPGIYSVELTVDNGTCIKQINHLITVEDPVSNLGIFTQNSDVGLVALAGTASHQEGGYTLTGSGSDIWNTNDEFHYIYRSFAGDGEVIAKVNSVSNTNLEAKAGIMFRSSNTADAIMALVMQRPDNKVGFEWRSATGGNVAWSGGWLGGTTAVKFIRLVRSGDQFSAYYSINSSQGPWTQIGVSQTLVMGAEVLLGLALTARDDGAVSTASFEKVSIRSIPNPRTLTINAKVYLQGPWNGTGLNTHLHSAGMIPLLQPFANARWNFIGLEQVDTIPDGAVDWVLVQVHDATNPSVIIARRACFVRNDGTLIDLDGSPGVDFGVMKVNSGSVSVHHRNHLGVMTKYNVNFN